MKKRPHAEQLQRTVDKFNARFPVGSEVILRTDTGEVETKVISEAMVLGGHTAVGWFEGVAGCYAIEGRVWAREAGTSAVR